MWSQKCNHCGIENTASLFQNYRKYRGTFKKKIPRYLYDRGTSVIFSKRADGTGIGTKKVLRYSTVCKSIAVLSSAHHWKYPSNAAN